MKNKLNKPRTYYSDSFKLGIVTRVANGQMSKEEARLAYNIGGNSLILEWMRKFGYCSHPDRKKPMAKSHGTPDPEQLKKKVRQLEKQLEDERIRSEFYQTMIDVAERELGISIRKKSDTNPSD